MDAGLGCLFGARQAEREASDETLAGFAAGPGEPHELLPTDRHDPLESTLDAALRNAEVRGDLQASHAMAVEHRDLALAVREPRENRADHPLDLRLVLTV